MSDEKITEESFSSDEEFEEDGNTDSESDVDAKLAEEEVFDAEFLKCYAALKKKDDKIYDKNVKFFSEDFSSSSDDEATEKEDGQISGQTRMLPTEKTKAPKMTLLDHQLSIKEDEIEQPELLRQPKVDLNKPISKSFYEKELEEIKKSIEKVSENVDSDSDDELLVVKGSESQQSKPKKSKVINTLLDKIEEDDDEELKHLKELWDDNEKLTEEEKFLRDYILNKRYLPASSGTNEDQKGGFFSKNLDELSDVETDDEGGDKKVGRNADHHSEEKDFDKITRIPRNSTKTIRDLVEKQEKKEKRLKKVEKKKKQKKSLKGADCEDIVGDLQTKFHYRETEPNDYGLSAEELLMATDEELEKWIKLKDAIAYKSEQEELALKKKYDKRRDDMELKKKIFKSIYQDSPGVGVPEDEEFSKKKGKKRRRDDAGDKDDQNVESSELAAPSKSSKKKRHKRGLNHKKFAKTGVAPDRLLAYGISKTKLKKSKFL